MRVGIFLCDSFPEDYYLSIFAGKFAWMVNNLVPVDSSLGKFSIEFNYDILPENLQELVEYLEVSGFTNVEII